MNTKTKKALSKTAGVMLGIAALAGTLAKYELHAAKTVLSGAENMANAFAPAPKIIEVGQPLLNEAEKLLLNKPIAWLNKASKKMWDR